MSKKQRFSILAINHEKENYVDYISDIEVKSYDLQNDEIDGCILVKQTSENTPKWKTFVNDIAKDDIEGLISRSSSAVLFLKVDQDYCLVYCFGYGRNMINPKYIVQDFGLKVTLNSIDSNNITNVDKYSINTEIFKINSQPLSSTKVNSFNIDKNRDVLKSISGTSLIDSSYIAGNGAYLSIAEVPDIDALKELSRKLISTYKDESYKKHFSWVDNIKQISTKEKIITELQEELVRKIASKEFDNIILDIPEYIQADKIEGFSYTRAKKNLKATLNIIDYFSTFKDDTKITERIKKDKVFVQCEGANEPMEYKIFECLTTELQLQNNTYILLLGKWYEIDNSFNSIVNKEISNIPKFKSSFPPLEIKVKQDNKGNKIEKIEKEGDYNVRAAASSKDYILMDKKLFRVSSESGGIEFCDILSKQKQLIHVKHLKGASSGLSHLFSQGHISATLLQSEKEIRKKVRNFLKSDKDLIPLKTITPSEFEIVYYILLSKDKNTTVDKLPFFSKINLYNFNKDLKRLGFNVSIGFSGINKH